MSFVKIWVHAVWATKKREKCLSHHMRSKLFKHIHDNAIGKNIYMDCVGGYRDHVHCLFRLRNDQMINDVLRLIKGESSHWINQNELIVGKFVWQKEYFTVSVSESQVDRVRMYILNQESHHRQKTFTEEYEEFIKKFGFSQSSD